MKIEQITVTYDDHMGSDLKVVNAARASFGKKSEWEWRCWSCNGLLDVNHDHCPHCGKDNSGGGNENRYLAEKDKRLIHFLARGYTSDEWDALATQFLVSESADDVKDLIRAVKVKAQHWAPFAHPQLSVYIKAPIFTVRQLMKHQVGGVWSETSRRYVDEEPGMWFEDQLHRRPEGNIKQGASAEVILKEDEPDIWFMGKPLNRFDLAQLNVDWYMQAVHEGVAPEEAREHLQLNMMTEWLWTGSLLFFARVCNQRLDPHAQSATRKVAEQIHPILQEHFPVSTEALVYVP